jgi:hypothetical protein
VDEKGSEVRSERLRASEARKRGKKISSKTRPREEKKRNSRRLARKREKKEKRGKRAWQQAAAFSYDLEPVDLVGLAYEKVLGCLVGVPTSSWMSV